MKIAIDIHGVISADPDKWRNILERLRKYNIEIHILSGPRIEDCIKELESYSILPEAHYDALFSIIDNLIEINDPNLYQDDQGRWWTKEENWDSQKGQYCKEHCIDLCIDNSYEYKKYMPEFTLFVHINSDDY